MPKHPKPTLVAQAASTAASVYADGLLTQAPDVQEAPGQSKSPTGPIVRPKQTWTHPIEFCPPDVAALLEAKSRKGRIPKLFECFLQITNQRFAKRWNKKSMAAAMRLFVGAVYSDKFNNFSDKNRYSIAALFQKAAVEANSSFTPIYLHSERTSAEAAKVAAEFERTELNAEKVILWSGWPTVTSGGLKRNLPLAPFYLLYGAAWTQQFYETLNAWLCASKGNTAVGIKELGDFLSQHRPPASALANPLQVGNIWRLFFDYYKSVSSHRKSLVVIEQWIKFRHIAMEVLPSSGLVAKPQLAFPGPSKSPSRRGSAKPGSPTQAGTDEAARQTLLLVDVPLHLSDTEALETLLKQVPASLSSIKRWAAKSCEEMMARYRSQKIAARSGSIRRLRNAPRAHKLKRGTTERWKVHKDNPSRLENFAATFAANGFKTNSEIDIQHTYGGDSKSAAHFLAVPTAKSLMPFATTLVLEHPELTPSSLHAVELFDKHGNNRAIRRIESGTYLVTHKYRKGAKRAELRIKLNARSLRAIRSLLVLTDGVRKYLRDKEDDNWRFLFLETGIAFGKPLRVRHFFSNPERMASELQNWAGLPPADAEALASRFSLRALRSTVGIQALIDSHSEHVMAKVIGHDDFKPSLLGRYLPPQLLGFFRVRWIRAFQTALIIRVTEGSPWQLKASGMKDAEQMAQFLENNAFPKLDNVLTRPPKAEGDYSKDGTFYFNANPQTLTFLARLMSQKEEGDARYWATAGRHIFNVLAGRKGIDPTLDEMVDNALRAAETAT